MLDPSLRHCQEVVEPLGGGGWWEEVRSLGVCPLRGLWDSAHFLALFLTQPPRGGALL